MDHETCTSCGFDGADYDSRALIEALQGLGSSWRRLVAECGGALRVRPEPEVWSAIEYATHSRDVTALHAFGVEQALTTEEPEFPAINGEDLIQSAAASYCEADPDDVINSLARESTRLALLAEDAGTHAWGEG